MTESDMARVSDGEMKWNERPYQLVDWAAEEKLGRWTQMWRAKWNLKPRGPLWLPEIIRMTWFLQVCGMVMGIHQSIDGDMAGAFFYSRTSCCGESGTPKQLPAHYDVHWPKTFNDYHVNVSHLKACDVPLLSPDDSAWSHSAYCPNWSYVKAFTQNLNAGRSMSLTAMSLLCMPIGAGLADKRGRKVILVMVHVLAMKSILCNLVSSTPFFVHLDPRAYLLYASALLSGMASGSGPTNMAMMVDLIPGNMREQGFPMLRLFTVPGKVIVFAIGYPLLAMHMKNYTTFWMVSLLTDFVCLAFFVIFLPESMPDKLKQPVQKADLFPGTYYWRAIKIILKYPLLVGILPSIAVNSFAGSGMGSVKNNQLWMGPLKFKQEQTLIPHLVRMCIDIPANSLAAVVIPRIGVWKAIFGGYAMHLVFGLLADMWPIYIMNHYNCWGSTHCGNGDWGTHLWLAKWGGTISKEVVSPFVDAIHGPAEEAMLSMQVSQTEQASVQAAFSLVRSLSGMYAPLFFTNHFFNTSWTSWRVITFSFVGYSVHAIGLFLYFLAYRLDRYLVYHSTARVVTAKPTATAQRLSGQDATINDYRRAFYTRAETTYQVSGAAADNTQSVPAQRGDRRNRTRASRANERRAPLLSPPRQTANSDL